MCVSCLCICVCVCVFMCVCMQTLVSMYICAHEHTERTHTLSLSLHKNQQHEHTASACVYVHTLIRKISHLYVYTCIQVSTCVYVHTLIRKFSSVRIYMHINTHTPKKHSGDGELRDGNSNARWAASPHRSLPGYKIALMKASPAPGTRILKTGIVMIPGWPNLMLRK